MGLNNIGIYNSVLENDNAMIAVLIGNRLRFPGIVDLVKYAGYFPILRKDLRFMLNQIQSTSEQDHSRICVELTMHQYARYHIPRIDQFLNQYSFDKISETSYIKDADLIRSRLQDNDRMRNINLMIYSGLLQSLPRSTFTDVLKNVNEKYDKYGDSNEPPYSIDKLVSFLPKIEWHPAVKE